MGSSLLNGNSIALSRYLTVLDRNRYITILGICMNSSIVSTTSTITPRASASDTLRCNSAIIYNQRTTIDLNTTSMTINNATVNCGSASLRVINRIIGSRFQNTTIYSNITIMIYHLPIARYCIPTSFDLATLNSNRSIGSFILNTYTELTISRIICNASCSINQTALHYKITIYSIDNRLICLITDISLGNSCNLTLTLTICRSIGAVLQGQLTIYFNIACTGISRLYFITIQVERNTFVRCNAKTSLTNVRSRRHDDCIASFCIYNCISQRSIRCIANLSNSCRRTRIAIRRKCHRRHGQHHHHSEKSR